MKLHFLIHQDKESLWWWDLVAPEAEKLMAKSAIGYETRDVCLSAIDHFRVLAPGADVVDLTAPETADSLPSFAPTSPPG